MGFLSGLFGGGGTKVSQQAANTTTVDVGVGIEMDMGPIAAVMEWLGLKQVEYQQENLALTEQGQKTVQDLLTSMQATEKKQVEQNQKVIDTVLPWVSRVSFAVLLALAVFIWKKWK